MQPTFAKALCHPAVVGIAKTLLDADCRSANVGHRNVASDDQAPDGEKGGFGPAAIGFYRVFFALPFLWLVLLAAPGKAEHPKRTRRPTGLLALAGFFFAIDLVSWHWSIKYTTVANATLLANFAPLWVMLWAGRLFGERITPRFLGALGLAFVGATVLMNASFRISPEQLFGDALSLLTAISYGSYMLTVKKLRETCSCLLYTSPSPRD